MARTETTPLCQVKGCPHPSDPDWHTPWCQAIKGHRLTDKSPTAIALQGTVEHLNLTDDLSTTLEFLNRQPKATLMSTDGMVRILPEQLEVRLFDDETAFHRFNKPLQLQPPTNLPIPRGTLTPLSIIYPFRDRPAELSLKLVQDLGITLAGGSNKSNGRCIAPALFPSSCCATVLYAAGNRSFAIEKPSQVVQRYRDHHRSRISQW